MKTKKLTPLEILQKQKKDLQIKSDELSCDIENHAKYLQVHFVPLLRNSVMESAISIVPSPLRTLTGNLLQKDYQKTRKTTTQGLPVRKVAQGIAIGITAIAPFFLKGKKGAVISIILKQILKWLT